MNKIMKVLIPVGIGFCLGRTRVLIKNSEKKFEAHVDLTTPMFVTESSTATAIKKLEERVSEIEDYFNIGTINNNDVEVI